MRSLSHRPESSAAWQRLSYEPSLDGLRGVSIGAVVAYHACALSGLGWVNGGFLGVSVFFTLSGFLITRVLLDEQRRAGSISPGHFWGRRIRRLAPASLVVMAAVTVLSATTDLLVIRSSDLTASAWSYMNWHVISLSGTQVIRSIGPLGPTWSLSVEEQCYGALFLLVVVCLRSAHPRRWLGILCAGGWVAGIVVANAVGGVHPRVEFGTDTRAAEVLCGVALALVPAWPAGPAWVRRHTDSLGAGALVVIVVLMLRATFAPPWLLHGGFALVGVLSAVVVIGLLAHGRLAAALSWRPLVSLGRLSYSLYVVHWPTMLALGNAGLGLHGVRLALVDIACSVVLATLLHRLVEQPVRHLNTVSARLTVGAWVAATAALTLVGAAVL